MERDDKRTTHHSISLAACDQLARWIVTEITKAAIAIAPQNRCLALKPLDQMERMNGLFTRLGRIKLHT